MVLGSRLVGFLFAAVPLSLALAGEAEQEEALEALRSLEPQKADLRCSACLWAARALREALVERMPKRVKSAKKRHELAREVLEPQSAAGDSVVCSAKRFPQDMVITGTTPSTILHPAVAEKRKYSDLLEVRGGKQAPIRGEHMQLMASKKEAQADLRNVCELLVAAFRHDVAARVEGHTGRAYGAVTDRWLCVRAASLCPESEVPPGKDDEDEEEGEL